MTRRKGRGRVAVSTSWRFDPVTSLPGDLAAVILSYVPARTLLRSAQRVCRAWRNAINGGLPALWHEVHSDISTLGYIAKKSCGVTQSLRASISTKFITHLHMFCGLRDLDITLTGRKCSITPVLSSFPLLEKLVVSLSNGVVFPPLRFLKEVRCCSYKLVDGLHNLPALTTLSLQTGCNVADDEWPLSLRQVAIYSHNKYMPSVLGRIASLPQLAHLHTDWSFAYNNHNTCFTPPYDQLSFLSRLSTLEHLALCQPHDLPVPPCLFFHFLGALSHMRELILAFVKPADDDLRCLPQLTNLEHITVKRVNTITQRGFRYVCAVPNLRELYIDECAPLDYSCVDVCSHLRVFAIWDICRSGGVISRQSAEAIARLQHLEKLILFIALQSSDLVSLFCAIMTLRELRVCSRDIIPVTAFADLRALSHLELIHIGDIEDICEFVQCLVQMPSLRFVYFRSRHEISQQDMARLRNALPRLEYMGRM